jgi:RNA polymerase sigma-70 factor (ECF subfamily)
MQAGATMDNLAISIALPSDEAAFVAELQSGSEQAFAQLIDRYHQPLYSLIARSLQDPSDAADITQDVFLKVFRSIGGFHGESTLRTWLYRIALREASNRRRWWSRHRRREIDLDAPCSSRCATDAAAEEHTLISTLADGGPSPFDQAAQQENRERVEAALRQVPTAFRAVVVLREIDGLAYEEIADLLHINLGTVKSRLMRGRAALRAALLLATDAAISHRTLHPAQPEKRLSSLPYSVLDSEPLSLDSELEVSR